MQNRYVGDIGDYIKYALLRKLTEGCRLGVAWYLFPDENNNDGGHTEYLCPPTHWKSLGGHLFQKDPPQHWEGLDSSLYWKLKSIVKTERHTRLIEADCEILGRDTVFFSEVLRPPEHIAEPSYFNARTDWRKGWFGRLREALDCCDVVFVDPDNGLCEDRTDDKYEKFRYGTVKHWKRIPLSEVHSLAVGDRTIVIFHHNTMRIGGHEKEIAYWIDHLGQRTVAVRASSFGARTFFVVNPIDGMMERLSAFCDRSPKFTLHPKHPASVQKPTKRQLVVRSTIDNDKQASDDEPSKPDSPISPSDNPQLSLSNTIGKAKAFSIWLGTRMDNASIADSDRNIVALALFQQSLDIADAVLLLVDEHRLHGPAYSIVRPLFESYVRGLWILRCAADNEVEEFLQDKCPKFPMLTREIGDHAPEHYSWIQDIRQGNLRIFHSFTHGGGAHVWRRYRTQRVEANYPEWELRYLILFGVEIRIRIGALFFDLVGDCHACIELDKWAKKFDRALIENVQT